MKLLILGLCCLRSGGLSAQKAVWQPSPGHTEVALWPGAVPDAQPLAGPENDTVPVTKPLVAGRTWIWVTHVSRPTMTVYSPTGKNTGAAIVVFPGGAIRVWLSISRARRYVIG